MAFALLGKLLDIEWLLHLDERRSSEELQRQDRALLGPEAPTSAARALELWLDRRRAEHEGRTVGTRASELLTVLHLVLVVLSVLAGMGAAQALLHSPSAREPTNVLTFLSVTLIAPLGLLFGSLVLLALRGRLGRSILIEDLYLLGLSALERLSRRAGERVGSDVSGDGIAVGNIPVGSIAAQWRMLRRSARRYRDLEVASLLSAAQWYPIGFHLGAALTLTGSALFSNLAFAWSTTNDSLQPATLASLAHIATAPWCDTLGVGCVSSELVHATQFSRFTEQYSLPSGAALSGAWWPALLGCLLLYGVLPRLAFSLGLRALVSWRSARLVERVPELRGRLLGPSVRISGPPWEPEAAGPQPLGAERAARPSASVLPCWVIGWRGAALSEQELGALCARLGLLAQRRSAAGDGDFEHDETLLGSAAELSAVLLLVEGWEAPDKATRRFITGLRRGTDRPVFVGVLLDSEATSALAIWRDRLLLLEDPGVSVEAVVIRSRSAAQVAGT
ncbi:MAG: hypothetical protein RL685_3047 [Pseudomonadota bacterium]